jgi:hypothetical protein
VEPVTVCAQGGEARSEAARSAREQDGGDHGGGAQEAAGGADQIGAAQGAVGAGVEARARLDG